MCWSAGNRGDARYIGTYPRGEKEGYKSLNTRWDCFETKLRIRFDPIRSSVFVVVSPGLKWSCMCDCIYAWMFGCAKPSGRWPNVHSYRFVADCHVFGSAILFIISSACYYHLPQILPLPNWIYDLVQWSPVKCWPLLLESLNPPPGNDNEINRVPGSYWKFTIGAS